MKPSSQSISAYRSGYTIVFLVSKTPVATIAVARRRFTGGVLAHLVRLSASYSAFMALLILKDALPRSRVAEALNEPPCQDFDRAQPRVELPPLHAIPKPHTLLAGRSPLRCARVQWIGHDQTTTS